ncbi:MAG: hypothetical protein K1W34_06915 [Lachnospiraceae bacterium]
MAYTLEISPDFTIEDIHKIRECNYEVTQNMTVEEKLLYYNTLRSDAEEQIEKLRAKRLLKI